MDITKTLSEIFYPSKVKCIICDDEIFSDSSYCICDKCQLPLNENICVSCGRGVLGMLDFCDQCSARPCLFTMARSPLVYCQQIHNMIYRFKYFGGRYLAVPLAELLVDCFREQEWTVDEVTFVPMHKKRLKKRGYNQAELLAREFCKRTSLPINECLERIKYTTNLARMQLKQRQKAIKGAIGTKKGARCADAVLLIDDVYTSGTTVGECARLLKNLGAKIVYVLTVATSKMDIYLYEKSYISPIVKKRGK